MNIENPGHPAWHGTSVVSTIEAIRLSWKKIDGFSGWMYYWNEQCETVEQAVGLLHAIPLGDPRALRFLLAVQLAHGQQTQGHQPEHKCKKEECQLWTISETAERILYFHFLKSEYCWSALIKDHAVAGMLFEWLVDHRVRLISERGDIPQVVLGFLAVFRRRIEGWSESAERAKLLQSLGDRYYRALLYYDCEMDQENPACIEALRRIALEQEKRYDGVSFESLEEVAVHGQRSQATAAKVVILADAVRRGRASMAHRKAEKTKG